MKRIARKLPMIFLVLFTSLAANRTLAYYDPGTQRWLNRDPIGESGGINQFSLSGNEPADQVDPFGLFGDGQRCWDKQKQRWMDRIKSPKDTDTSFGIRPEYLGHSDFYGGDYFDFTKEDKGATRPYPVIGRPERHFQPPQQSTAEVERALAAGDQDAFERALHRLQDSKSHYDKGYRWNPGNGQFGHLFDGTKPDNDQEAWAQAEAITRPWVDRWYDRYGKPRRPSGGCN
jgi:uncharacterized protein RhaS with RHS repeats